MEGTSKVTTSDSAEEMEDASNFIVTAARAVWVGKLFRYNEMKCILFQSKKGTSKVTTSKRDDNVKKGTSKVTTSRSAEEMEDAS
jgi:hypothetical protein